MKDLLKRITRLFGGSGIIKTLNQSSDIILAFFVIVIIMMIIIPVPPFVIDTLIAINLTLSISLLMVSLYISKAVHLSIFPSILLITTLFRLGIEIAATKQILLYVYAGDVIFAFGNFVVGGNYVVGFVIFLIITIVQFIVVTKGAERVAEVAARFTLDAMPGKQMSIDADMRSGIIDSNQARQLRLALQKESQLYGAMDGAMKFVKGDVIAGIVIAVINIIGGLIIGMMMHNMPFVVAAQTYTLLSIGSGLVSQIPSLIISLTAGMVTTRVSSDKEDTNLGKDISNQILSHPKGILVAGTVILILSLIPAFPTPLFMSLALILYALGINTLLKQRRQKAELAASAASPFMETGPDGSTMVRGSGDDYSLTLPVILETGSYLSELIKRDREGGRFIEEKIPKMRYALYQDLGVRFPGVHIRKNTEDLEEEEYRIYLNEVPLVHGKVVKNNYLTNETEENLRRYNIPYTQTKDMMNLKTFWVERKYKNILDKAGIKYWEILDVVILHLSYFYRKYASEFLGIQEVREILSFIEQSFPDLVKEVTRLIPLQRLTDIIKRLVQEQISIKDLRTILESLSEWGQTEKDPVALTEYIRTSLKRYISYKYSQGQSVLAVYLLDPEIESMIRGAIKETSAGSYLMLDPDSVQLILQAVRAVIKPTPAGGMQPVVLTTTDIRRHTQKLLEGEFPEVATLSYQEIVPEIRIQPLGRIQFS